MKKIIALVAVLAAIGTAYAQTAKPKSSMQSEITSQLTDNNVGAITPSVMRGVLGDMVASYQQYASYNPQSGSSYTVQATDYGALLALNNATSVAVSLPAVSGSFGTGFNVFVVNNGSGSSVITPTGATIGGASSYSLGSKQGIWIISDGTNWQVWTNTPVGGSPPSLTASNTWSGTNKFNGDVFLGSGNPWVDVKSGANSCAAAVGDGSTDDTAAIQCQINFIFGAHNGGRVYFPIGNYKVTSAITVPAGIFLQGASMLITEITTLTDINVLHFTGQYPRLDNLFINGYQNSAASHATILLDPAVVGGIFSNFAAWGGRYGIQSQGSDNLFFNGFPSAWGTAGANIYGNGSADWFVRVKADTTGLNSPNFGMFLDLGSASGVLETHCNQCDFTGTFNSASLGINDTNNAHIIGIFSDSVFSNQIQLTHQKYSLFTGSEFGAPVLLSAGAAAIVGSLATTAITATGAQCAANISISC